MNNRLTLTIDGFSNIEDHGTKEDGTPDVRVKCGYEIRLVLNNTRILFEETLPRENLPVDPTEYLADRVRSIFIAYLSQIDPI